MIQLNKIILGDCMDVMREIPDKYFELAIVDPPYGIKRFDKDTGGTRFHRFGKTSHCNNRPDNEYFDELFRISTNQIIWGGNYYPYIWSYGGRGFIFWYKHQHLDNFADGEMAWTSFDKNAKCYDYPFSNVINTIVDKIHPWQKPVALYRWLLQNYAKPGDKIIDTHSGSGSCAIACHIEKHDFLAVEKDPDYHAASVKRLDEVRAQGVLF